MRVLIIRTTNRISGAEVYNLNLIKGLLHYKDVEIVFSSDYPQLNINIEKLGALVVPIKTAISEVGTKKQFIKALLFLPKIFSNYWKYFKKIGRFELVVFESMNEKLFLTLPLRMFNKHVVWIEHGPLYVTQRALIVKFFYRVLSMYANKILCVSKSTQLDLISGGINSSKTVVSYIGIDTNKFSPLNEDMKYKIKSKFKITNKSVIGFLGTLNREKGIFDFIDTMKHLVKAKRKILFLIVGNGSEMNEVVNTIRMQGLSRYCILTGHISNVEEYLGIMDVLVFPTHHNEGLSIALLEALSMGVPVVASDIGGNKEIVEDNLTGFLYKNFSPHKVSKLIITALKYKKKLGKNARELAMSKFPLTDKVGAFYSLFKETLYEK